MDFMNCSTINFTRVSVDENAFPDGEYTAELQKIEYKAGLYGHTISVEWMIVAPEEYKGRVKWENFNIGSDIPEYKKKAEISFNKFWSQMTDDEEGTIDDLQKVVFKEAILKMKNYPGKDGEMRPYIVHRKRTDKEEVQMNLYTPQTPTPSSAPLNDEIPF